MNSQVGNDYETVNSRNLILNKLNVELIARLSSLKEECELNTKSTEQYKYRMECMLNEQQVLASDLKAYKTKCVTLEKEVNDFKSKLDTNQMSN